MTHAASLIDACAVAPVLRRASDGRPPRPAGRHTPEANCVFFHAVFRRTRLLRQRGERPFGFAALAEGWLPNLTASQANRGAGIGSALHRAAVARADVGWVRTFRPKLPARRFCEARGFVTLQETDGSRSAKGEPNVLRRWCHCDG